MTVLYIGNTTKQVHKFCYRSASLEWIRQHPLERTKIIAQEIPSGQQIIVAPHGSNTNLTSDEIEAILDQHLMYGLIAADELDRFSFSGLLYSLDKPISEETLQRGIAKYEEQLKALGKQMRQEAAVAANRKIEQHELEIGSGQTVRELEMSFIQEPPKAPPPGQPEMELISEGVRVTAIPEEQRARR